MSEEVQNADVICAYHRPPCVYPALLVGRWNTVMHSVEIIAAQE